MHTHLFRSKTRKHLNLGIRAILCAALAFPPAAFAVDAPVRRGDTAIPGVPPLPATPNGLSPGEVDARNEANQAKLDAHRDRVRGLEREASVLRNEALEMLKDPKTVPGIGIQFEKARRLETFKLDPNRNGTGAITSTGTTGAASGTPPEPTPAPPSARPAVAGTPMNYDSASPTEAIAHISRVRIPWLQGFGSLAARIIEEAPAGTAGALASGGTSQFDSKSGVLKPSLDERARFDLIVPSQYSNAVNEHGSKNGAGLTPRALGVAKMHVSSNSALGEVPRNLTFKRGTQTVGAAEDDPTLGPLFGHAPEVRPTTPTPPGAAAPTAPEPFDMNRIFTTDVEQSVKVSVEALQAALRKLNAAKDKMAEAAEARANPPKITPPKPNTAKNNQNPNSGGNQSPSDDKKGDDAGKGGDKGDKGNKKDGQPLQAAQMPQPAAMGDSRGLFDAAKNAPITPDVSAVADASKFEQLPFPQFGGLPANGIQIPGISRPPAGQAVAATSGGVPQNAPTNIIPGEFRPAQAIDRGMFDKPAGGDGGGGGGGDRPLSVSTGGTGGVAGGSFEGDVGKGIGPAYGGKAGLNDPVKKYEVGAGGGANNTESAGTISTGADGGIPPQLQGQLATGKKMKDGPGRGGVGLMGQVYSLIQTQCTDQTQRGKMEDFCTNASAVSGRAKAQVAYSKPEAPRRDLASDRGVTSSK